MMRAMIACGVLWAATASGQASPPAAQNTAPPFTGRIVGVYNDVTGEPIDSVEVRDMMGGSSALTTSTGTVALSFVADSGSLIRFRKIGYRPLAMFVSNQPGDAPLTVTLEPAVAELPRVVTVDSAPRYISPGLRGFEERRKRGQGSFIPESFIRQNDHRTLGNLIMTRIRGVTVVQDVRVGMRRADVIRTMRGGCSVDVYLDGVPMSMGKNVADLKEFLPLTLAAIEYHSTATLPPEFSRPGGGCGGVLLLWSRER
jgi:hypothetical protein